MPGARLNDQIEPLKNAEAEHSAVVASKIAAIKTICEEVYADWRLQFPGEELTLHELKAYIPEVEKKIEERCMRIRLDMQIRIYLYMADGNKAADLLVLLEMRSRLQYRHKQLHSLRAQMKACLEEKAAEEARAEGKQGNAAKI